MFAGRKFRAKFYAVLLAVAMIMILPGVSLGAGNLSFLTFVSSADNNLTTGVTSTINFRLWDDGHPSGQYTGTLGTNLWVYINNSNNVPTEFTASTSYSAGIYSIANVKLNAVGTYTLYVTDGLGHTATGTITVANANVPAPTTTHHLSYFTFVSNSDNNLITGETSNINFRMWDDGSPSLPFSGSVTAYIADSNGNTTSYTVGQGSSISNVTLDKAGTYTLVLTDTNGYTASGTITVTDAKISTTGSLAVNFNDNITAKLVDANGNPLSRRSVTVDATAVGGTVTSYTTLFDGTFTFSMIPTVLGPVTFSHGGHIISTLQVTPAYTAGARIGGNSTDNASLSVLVAQQGWTKADTIILTRDDVVADAMVAAPLSKRFDAPILMTPTDSLNNSVLAEIRYLNAKTVLIIGGTGAVSSSVSDTLSSNGLKVVRFDGADRYDTASKIAGWVGSPGTVYMAYGYGEPDALAAGALAAEQGIPILLTDTNTLPDTTQSELNTLAPSNVMLLGGTGVISSGLEAQLGSKYAVQRWGGIDRYATEQIIFQNFFNQKPFSNQYPLYVTSALVSPSDVTSGNPYGDALVTAALAAKKNGFVITLPPNTLPSPISTFLLFNKVYVSSGTVVGNTSAISRNLEQLLQQGLAH
ncbi:MAG: cell wall-binding repeat-containing protein [Desulfitobacteriaceae bacterium]